MLRLTMAKLSVVPFKTEEMRTSIHNCFHQEGLVGIAKMEETYARCDKAAYDKMNFENYVVRDIEPEENLGPIPAEEDDNVH